MHVLSEAPHGALTPRYEQGFLSSGDGRLWWKALSEQKYAYVTQFMNTDKMIFILGLFVNIKHTYMHVHIYIDGVFKHLLSVVTL